MLKKLLGLAVLLAGMAFATTPTTVTDTIKDPSMQPVKGGTISISFPYVCQEPDGSNIESIYLTVPINSVGVFSVALAPTDVCVPAGTSYLVTYSLPQGITRAPEIWTVPSSGSPIGLSSVVTFPPPIPTAIIALSLLSPSGATTGQCISWTGTAWAPGSCGNLPNIVTPGTNTKITYNAQGLVTAGVQAQFTDIGGTVGLAQLPIPTTQDILYNDGGLLTHLSISTVTNGQCLGNSGGVWATMACSGGAGSGTVINDATLTAGRLVIGNGTVHVTVGDLSGDITTFGNTTTVLATVNSNIGSCGDATHVGQVTLNAKGLATACTAVSITAGSFPSASAQLQFLRVKANQGNLTTFEFAGPKFFYASDYAFTAQAPGGSLTAATPATVALSPCPLGLAGADLGHYVYISAGTGGAAEAVHTAARGR